MKNKQVQKLYNSLANSMLGYRVNGNPVQRKMELLNIAKYLLTSVKYSVRDIKLTKTIEK